MQAALKQVIDLKGSSVQSTSPDETVSAAVEQMHRQNIGALLVLDGDAVAGIFTERDVLFRVVHGGLDPAATRVSEVMTKELWSAPASMTVERVMGEISERRIRHVPVMEDGQLVGLVSSGDLTRWVSTAQRDEIQELEKEVKAEGFKFKSTVVLVIVFAVLIAIGVMTT